MNSAGGAPQNGAVAYYAREFDTASSTTDGLQEAIDYCIATVGERGCVILLGRGTYELQSQLSFVKSEPTTTPNAITTKGTGIARSGLAGTRIRILSAVSGINANCSGEEGTAAGGWVDGDIDVCAGILVVGQNHRFEDLEILTSAAANADVLMELASRSSAGSAPSDMDVPPAYTTSHTIFENVRFTDGDLAQVYISNRDNQAGSQSDANDWRHVSFGSPNFLPRYAVFVDNSNTSVNIGRHIHIREFAVAGINIRQGEFSLDGGFSESDGGAGSADKWLFRYCSDKLTDADSSIAGAEACGDLSGSNWKRGYIANWHHESLAGHGGFFFRDGPASTTGLATEFVIRDTSIQLADASAKYLKWDGVGTLTLSGVSFNNTVGGLNAIDIDCDGCSGADNRNVLELTLHGNTPEPTDVDLQIDRTDEITAQGIDLLALPESMPFDDWNADKAPDAGEAFASLTQQAACAQTTPGAATMLNLGLPASVTGTASTPALGTSSLLASIARLEWASAAASGSSAGIRANADHVARGNSSGRGGFAFFARIYWTSALATQRFLVGLKDATAVTGNVEPNTTLDTVYFGCDSADTNTEVCSNDNSGVATCTTLGASFPCETANALYDVWLLAEPNASSISYRVDRLDVAATTSGTLTTDLPRNSVFLGYEIWGNNGATASAVTVGAQRACTWSRR